jgi:hypothetical protein
MFPLQTSRRKGIVPGPLQIPWSVAEKAYGAYAREYGKGQSLERLAERGGFGWCEMDDLYPQWRAEASEIAELRSEITAKDAEIERLREQVKKLRIALSGALGMHDGHTEHDEKAIHEMACITLIETSPEITQ